MKCGIPIVTPIGGRGIFIDARKFLPHVRQDQFPAQALAAELYTDAGIRTMSEALFLPGEMQKLAITIIPNWNW